MTIANRSFSAPHRTSWVMLKNKGSHTSGEDGAKLLGKAVTAYRAALTIHTQTDHPADWATMQRNLARAFEAIAEHESCTAPRNALQTALNYVGKALLVFEPEHMPYDNGLATKLRADITAKLEALD